MSDMPANVAPPLKSTSTMLSCSGEWVMARPSTSVRRNSDLPEPVAPMTRPCGPMPCWADSLMSRWIGLPPSPTPIGTRSRSRAGRVRHAAFGSKRVDVAEPEEVHEVGGSGDLAAAGVGGARGHGVERGQPAGERLGGGQVALVGERLRPAPRAAGGRGSGCLPSCGGSAANCSAQPAGVVELVPAAGQVDDGHAVQAVGRDHVVARRQLGRRR